MNSSELAASFRRLAYKDYIAARILLNKGYAMQGLTLASTAIEKYLKVVLISKGLGKWDINVHLNRLDKLQKLLSDHYVDFTGKFDIRFLELLGQAYQVRYYDDLKQPIMIGFFIGQFLCELDYAFNILEQVMKVSDAAGNELISPYRRAVNERDADLINNNFIFQNISKKEVMERPDQGFGLYIDPANGNEIEVEGTAIRNEYDGRMAYIKLDFKP